ncbi:MAG: LytR C-terminal domain-containing protein [Bacteroidota bacterium]|nr:LytR C-terminal domain-containing protein [Bacteroidota bacterium]
MKEKTQARKPSEQKPQSSASNIILNIVIGLLAIVILFLGYTIFQRLNQDSKKTSQIQAQDAAKKEKPSQVIQVEVLNGCGTSGTADKFTDFLRNKNIDVVQSGNYLTFDVENTLILNRTGNKANARKVADILNIDYKNIVEQKNDDYLLDLSIVVGKDYYKLKPYK